MSKSKSAHKLSILIILFFITLSHLLSPRLSIMIIFAYHNFMCYCQGDEYLLKKGFFACIYFAMVNIYRIIEIRLSYSCNQSLKNNSLLLRYTLTK